MAEKRQVSQQPQRSRRQQNQAYQPYKDRGTPYAPQAYTGNGHPQREYPNELWRDPAPPQQSAPMNGFQQSTPASPLSPENAMPVDPAGNVAPVQSPLPKANDAGVSGNRIPDMMVKDWIVTLLLVAIPIVGIILLFVWAFSDPGEHPSRKTYAQAGLIMTAIVIVIYIVLGAMIGSMVGSMFNSMMYY